MATGNWIMYDKVKARILNKEIDFDTDTFKVAMMTSSYSPSLTDDEIWADISANEVSGNGYAQATLASLTITELGSTTRWDAADFTIGPASGGDIVARYLVIYDDTHASDALICYQLLDTTPADVTTTDGATFSYQVNASGILNFGGATS